MTNPYLSYFGAPKEEKKENPYLSVFAKPKKDLPGNLQPIPGGQRATTPVETPGFVSSLAKATAENIGSIPARVKEGIVGAAELPALSEEVKREASRRAPQVAVDAKRLFTVNPLARKREQGEAANAYMDLANKGMLGIPREEKPNPFRIEDVPILGDLRQSVREDYDAARERVSEAAQGLPPVAAAYLDTMGEAGAAVLDPTNFLPAGAAVDAARAARPAARLAAKEVAQAVTRQGEDFVSLAQKSLDLADSASVRLQEPRSLPAPAQIKPPRQIVEEAAESADLGITRLDEGERLFVVKSPEGRDVGSLVARQDEDGFRVRHIFVDESARGQAVPEELYRAAHQEMGVYQGSTDYLGRRTPAGERMAARLQETAPEIFQPPARAPRSAEAGFIRLGPGDAPPPDDPIVAAFRQDFMPDKDPDTPPLSAKMAGAKAKLEDDFEDVLMPSIRAARRVGEDWARTAEQIAQNIRGGGATALRPITKYTEVWDANAHTYRPTGEGFTAIVDKLSTKEHRELEAFMAAKSHMEDLRLHEQGMAEFNATRAIREQQKREVYDQVLRARSDVRTVEGDLRATIREASKAQRRAGRSLGQAEVRNPLVNRAIQDALDAEAKGKRGRWSVAEKRYVQAEQARQRYGATDLRASAESEVALDTVADLASLRRQQVAQELRQARKQGLLPPPKKNQYARYGIDPEATIRAQELLDHFNRSGKMQQLEATANRVYDWYNRANLDALQSVGFISKQRADEVKAMRLSPAMFERVIEDDLRRAGVDVRAGEATAPAFMRSAKNIIARRSSPLKARTVGGLSKERPLRPVLEAMTEQAVRTRRLMDRQALRNFLGELVDTYPGQFPDMQYVKSGNAPSTIPVFKDGAKQLLQVPDDIREMTELLTPHQGMWVFGWARWLASALQTGATSTVSFAARGMARDLPTAFVRSQHGMLPGEPLFQLGKEMYSWLTTGAPTRQWQDFMESPAAHAVLNKFGRDKIQGEISRARTLARPGGKRRQLMKDLLNPLYIPQQISAAMDAAPRVVEMDLARSGGRRTIGGFPIPGTKGKRQGIPMSQAVVDASDVTLNFSKKGKISRQINQYVPFFSAELNDFASSLRAMSGGRRMGVISRALAVYTLPAIGMAMAGHDDPEYQDLSEADKMLFYHPNRIDSGPLAGWWVRVPRGLGIMPLLFSYLPQKAVEYAMGDDPDAVRNALGGIVESTPLHFVADYQEHREGSGYSFSLDGVPTAATPILEGVTNYDFYKRRPLVSRSLEKRPAPEQFTERTSPFLREVAQGVAERGGPEVSPILAQNTVEGYFGGVGRMGLDVFDAGTRKVMGEDDPSVRRPGDYPLLRSFVAPPPIGSASSPVQEFYAAAERAEGAYAAALDAATAEPDPAMRRQAAEEMLLGQYPEGLYFQLYDGSRQVVRDLEDYRDEVVRSKAYSREEKLDLLQKIDGKISTIAILTQLEVERRERLRASAR